MMSNRMTKYKHLLGNAFRICNNRPQTNNCFICGEEMRQMPVKTLH